MSNKKLLPKWAQGNTSVEKECELNPGFYQLVWKVKRGSEKKAVIRFAENKHMTWGSK